MSDDTPPTEPQSNLDRVVGAMMAAYTKARLENLPAEHKARWEANTEFAEALEQEMVPLARAVIADMGDPDNLPEGFRALLDEAGDPGHQFGWWVQIMLFVGNVLGTAVALSQIGSQVSRNELWQHNPAVPISPADASDAVVRGILDLHDAEVKASMSGINAENFDTLVKLTGEPPGPMDMLSLYRRGVITKDFLVQAIKYSRIKDEYIDAIIHLAHSYMSPADVIELAIKGLRSPDEAKTMYGIAGGLEEQFELLYEGAGNAIGNEAALTLYNHGQLTEAEVHQVFGRSRMNPIFYPMAFKLRHHWLSAMQISRMVTAGTANQAEATKWLIQDGYPPDQVAALVSGAGHSKAAKVHTETTTMVTAMYLDHLLTKAEAETALHNIGYDATSAQMILELTDAKRALSQTTTAVSAIRSAYLAHRITKEAASSDLDKLQLPVQARDTWLTAWDIERTTKVRELTEAQIGGMAKKGILTYPEAMARWIGMGYSKDDAQLLAENYGAPKAKA